jgi:glycerate 2-kinase
MTRPLQVVIAPDSFKGTVAAPAAAAAIARGWGQLRPHDRLDLRPQADGGEGTLDAIAGALPAAVYHPVGPVTGPDGRAVEAGWLELPDGSAVVELAQCSGITLLDEPDPLGATTRGLGELISRLPTRTLPAIIIALGGSASTDGGTGALAALGLGLLDSSGAVLPDGGGSLDALVTIDRSALRALPRITLLTDVRSPLLGPTGAARVFAPQKGASPTEVMLLERGLARLADRLGAEPSAPGMGAAGGTAFGFAAVYGAAVASGAAHVSALTGLDHALLHADLLITGEGRFDSQSMTGKVTGTALAAAEAAGAGRAVIAGSVELSADVWAASLSEMAGSAAAAMQNAEHWLEQAGRRAAAQLPAGLSGPRAPSAPAR